MLTIFVAFLAIEAVFLSAACIYVSPLIGTRSTAARPVEIAPLPLARDVSKPAAWRRR